MVRIYYERIVRGIFVQAEDEGLDGCRELKRESKYCEMEEVGEAWLGRSESRRSLM